MADSSDLRFKHLRPPTPAKASGELAPDQQSVDLEPMAPEPGKGGFSRRSFLSGLGAAGILAGAAPLTTAAPAVEPAPAYAEGEGVN